MTRTQNERHCRTALRAIAFALLGIASSAAHSQEFSFLAGALQSSSQNTYSWEANYREGLGPYAAWSFSWLNEGHIPDHHRDGQALQLWGRLPLWNERLELSAGAGPYRYFDTSEAQSGGEYSNTHGWGAMFTLRAAYYFDNRWIAEMKLNRVQAFGGPDTTALLFGIGYQLDAPEGRGPRARPVSRTTNVTNNEVTVMLGTTILNSPDSETNLAESIEYRRGLWRYFDFTASYLHEGGHVQSRRDGVAAQLWATRAFLNDKLTLGVGAGPYLSITQNDDLAQNRTGDGRFSGLVSVSASYRFSDRWLARVTWNRMVTRYDRDADIIEAGFGVRF
ncbi:MULTISPECIES: hypothetical protein [Caballeronia]|jgi:hypothetical protein|uniref:Uncharacterized protein n=1 Tax=Caballeronia zhejiangensis TaxID=871203 RepID=A0A656QP39_9BURK|nr:MULTISPECIES: hypothetical protein [Caballeronia]EKS66629.1 hypothetical protein BURK_032314 [Burkholderia sp. SJ98]KDR30893.1 hypothetical protein BG60_34710 [Caballeronia zhejiangensis]MCG7400197.1 hypothetical protein [Caballeronia zhejiangensis]MCI1042700.1 hypothetical protein [Caballeronia zhejiangensis]MDR5790094.1 hypothetical protein [Caballeronia sp. LP003]